jgi:hypothetical protein
VRLKTQGGIWKNMTNINMICETKVYSANSNMFRYYKKFILNEKCFFSKQITIRTNEIEYSNGYHNCLTFKTRSPAFEQTFKNENFKQYLMDEWEKISLIRTNFEICKLNQKLKRLKINKKYKLVEDNG